MNGGIGMKKLVGLLIACMLISMLPVGALANENSIESIPVMI